MRKILLVPFMLIIATLTVFSQADLSEFPEIFVGEDGLIDVAIVYNEEIAGDLDAAQLLEKELKKAYEGDIVLYDAEDLIGEDLTEMNIVSLGCANKVSLQLLGYTAFNCQNKMKLKPTYGRLRSVMNGNNTAYISAGYGRTEGQQSIRYLAWWDQYILKGTDIPTSATYPREKNAETALKKVEKPEEPIACPADAKVCPDGSTVSRTQPNCEFAECPEVEEPEEPEVDEVEEEQPEEVEPEEPEVEEEEPEVEEAPEEEDDTESDEAEEPWNPIPLLIGGGVVLLVAVLVVIVLIAKRGGKPKDETEEVNS